MNATDAFEAIRAFGEHEHRDLAHGLDHIHEVGCLFGSGSRLDDIRAMGEVLHWSTDTLAPHITWEEAWLYPQIDALDRDSLGDTRRPVRSRADPKPGQPAPPRRGGRDRRVESWSGG